MTHDLINLASARLGARAVRASDDFFADKSRMLADTEPVFIAGRYDDNGKWMDGWESRRRRDSGHDWCVVRLACPGQVGEIEFDTRHFTGNFAPAVSVQACLSDQEEPAADATWCEIIPMSRLGGDRRQALETTHPGPWSHVRLNLHPDGGIARLRVRGRPLLDVARIGEAEIDLAASLNGATALACNDEHFGSMHNLLVPGRGVNMGDGWETRRRREPGFDWVIIRLGHAGVVTRVEIDTAHFKGNHPDRCRLHGALLDRPDPVSVAPRSLYWETLLPEQKLSPDRIHRFEAELQAAGAVNCVRLDIIPDGGISRLRVFGRLAPESA